MGLKQSTDFLVYLVVRILICIVQALPIETCEIVARWLATLAADIVRMRSDVVNENLRLAFPELSAESRHRLEWRMWEHLFLMVAEIAHAPRKVHDTNWRQFFHFKDLQPMMRRFFADRPRVVVSGHFGNFELGGYIFGLFGIETFSVARPLDNRWLDRFVNQFRGTNGRQVLPKGGSAFDVAQLLADNGILSVLGDQHAGSKGCWVDFFGRPASTNKAIALFSLANDAPLFISYAKRMDRPMKFELAIEAVADPRTLDPDLNGVAELTQWHAHCLERIIRRSPEQYWWVHRRWKGKDPRPGRSLTKAA